MMEKVHFCNYLKYLTTLDGDGANVLRMYYMQRCKELLINSQLSKQYFGPSIMCIHCGSLWSKNKSQIRISPGKSYSKSIKRIIKFCTMNNQISKFQGTLMKKSIKNKMNKIIIKCLICFQNTKISCNKLDRPKLSKLESNQTNNLFLKKKKKKRRKDKMASLNLFNIESNIIRIRKEIESVNSTPKTIKLKPSNKKDQSSIHKIRKINATRLNLLLNVSNPKQSKNSLNNFLQELY